MGGESIIQRYSHSLLEKMEILLDYGYIIEYYDTEQNGDFILPDTWIFLAATQHRTHKAVLQ